MLIFCFFQGDGAGSSTDHTVPLAQLGVPRQTRQSEEDGDELIPEKEDEKDGEEISLCADPSCAPQTIF